MYQNGNYTAYQQVRVLSSSREELVPLLYERLLQHLRRASAQIEARDLEGKAASLTSASEIVFELLSSLDFEAGGEIASRLAALYGYFSREIMIAGRDLDRERLEKTIDMVASLHDAWVQAAAMARGNVAQGAASTVAQGAVPGEVVR